jgi:hypothetical protein
MKCPGDLWKDSVENYKDSVENGLYMPDGFIYNYPKGKSICCRGAKQYKRETGNA